MSSLDLSSDRNGIIVSAVNMAQERGAELKGIACDPERNAKYPIKNSVANRNIDQFEVLPHNPLYPN
jgi:hypothetical protein